MKANKEAVIILGIETSCDDTSVAIVEGGKRILSNLTASQVDFHNRFGGVVPEIASRQHLEALTPLIEETLLQAGKKKNDLNAIAVTYGPGLVGALLVGIAGAKALAYGLNIPLIPVNHTIAHIYANFLTYEDLSFPAMALVVSGGHTSLIYMEEEGKAQVIGKTKDDAAGEAFDKIARALDLGYPGGPVIDKLAETGNPEAIHFPRAYLGEEYPFDFSFSGLKSAVLNYINSKRQKGEEICLHDLAASFQQAVIEVLVNKAVGAAKKYNTSTLLLAGGVAANKELRKMLQKKSSDNKISVFIPPVDLCTDNAAMVASAAYPLYLKGLQAPLNLNAVPGLTPEKDQF